MALRLATWLAALLLMLSAPAAALAQGAGDDQYSDPFGSGQNEPEEPEEPQPTPEPAPPESETIPPAQPAPATSAQATPEPQQQLPYTGADEGLVALAGVILLAGGIALRLRLRA